MLALLLSLPLAFAQDQCPETPKTDPGLCGCDYQDVDTNSDTNPDSCVHFDAQIDPAATLGLGVTVHSYAIVANATIGPATTIGARAQVGAGASIGSNSVVGRRATVGGGANIGADASLGRGSSVGAGAMIGTGLTLGFGSVIADSAMIGDDLTAGSLTTVGAATLGDRVILARGAAVGDGSAIQDDVVMGPDVLIGQSCIVGALTRIRKDVQLQDNASVGTDVRIGRDTLIKSNASVGDDARISASVEVGAGSNLGVSHFAPRGTVYPDAYDADGDGEASIAMGGLDCDDANPDPSCDYSCDASCLPSFDVATLTPCGQTGATGPSQLQCDGAYAGSDWGDSVVVSSGYQTITLAQGGTYRISVDGARGGTHSRYGAGGNGAHIEGDFVFAPNTELVVVVGQAGQDGGSYDTSAGGGTFVALTDDTPVIVAGGGGAAGNCGATNTDIYGNAAQGNGNGGASDNDGGWCGCGGSGSAGGGFYSDGGGSGGAAFVNGAVGDVGTRPGQCVTVAPGGFGGGGNGGNGGGGGGGYQGGDAGDSIRGATGHGGRSFNSGSNPVGMSNSNNGHGMVVIERIGN